MVSQRLCGVPMEGRALRWPRRTPPRGGLVVWATTRRPTCCATASPTVPRPRAEPDPRHRARGRRRLRRQVRHLSGGRGPGRDGAQALPRAAPVGRDARRAHGGDDARPRPGDRPRGGGGARTARITALRMHVTRRHRRLSDLHVHPGPDAHDGRRRLQRSRTSTSSRPASSPTRPRWPPIAAPAARRLPTTSSARRRRSPPELGSPPEEVRRKNFIAPERLPLHHPDRPAATTAASTTGR